MLRDYRLMTDAELGNRMDCAATDERDAQERLEAIKAEFDRRLEIENAEEGYQMTDAEADADTLASAGWGTDEDYGCF